MKNHQLYLRDNQVIFVQDGEVKASFSTMFFRKTLSKSDHESLAILFKTILVDSLIVKLDIVYDYPFLWTEESVAYVTQLLQDEYQIDTVMYYHQFEYDNQLEDGLFLYEGFTRYYEIHEHKKKTIPILYRNQSQNSQGIYEYYAIESIHYLMNVEDGYYQKSPFSESIREVVSLEDELSETINSHQIELFRRLMSYSQTNQYAYQIIQNGIENLCEKIDTLIKTNKINKIYLLGDLFDASSFWNERFVNRIRKQSGEIQIIYLTKGAINHD